MLEVDTAAPSELYARLCHAFLVFLYIVASKLIDFVCAYVFSDQGRSRATVDLCGIIRFTSAIDLLLPTAFGLVVFKIVDELNIYVFIYIVNINVMFETKLV